MRQWELAIFRENRYFTCNSRKLNYILVHITCLQMPVRCDCASGLYLIFRQSQRQTLCRRHNTFSSLLHPHLVIWFSWMLQSRPWDIEMKIKWEIRTQLLETAETCQCQEMKRSRLKKHQIVYTGRCCLQLDYECDRLNLISSYPLVVSATRLSWSAVMINWFNLQGLFSSGLSLCLPLQTLPTSLDDIFHPHITPSHSYSFFSKFPWILLYFDIVLYSWEAIWHINAYMVTFKSFPIHSCSRAAFLSLSLVLFLSHFYSYSYSTDTNAHSREPHTISRNF